ASGSRRISATATNRHAQVRPRVYWCSTSSWKRLSARRKIRARARLSLPQAQNQPSPRPRLPRREQRRQPASRRNPSRRNPSRRNPSRRTPVPPPPRQSQPPRTPRLQHRRQQHRNRPPLAQQRPESLSARLWLRNHASASARLTPLTASVSLRVAARAVGTTPGALAASEMLAESGLGVAGHRRAAARDRTAATAQPQRP